MAEVRMINSVDEWVAGETYELEVTTADYLIVMGYAEGPLSREFSDEERQQLRANHQEVSV